MIKYNKGVAMERKKSIYMIIGAFVELIILVILILITDGYFKGDDEFIKKVKEEYKIINKFKKENEKTIFILDLDENKRKIFYDTLALSSSGITSSKEIVEVNFRTILLKKDQLIEIDEEIPIKIEDNSWKTEDNKKYYLIVDNIIRERLNSEQLLYKVSMDLRNYNSRYNGCTLVVLEEITYK